MLEGTHLNLGIKVNRKKKSIITEDLEVDLKGEVNKLANACVIVAEFIV